MRRLLTLGPQEIQSGIWKTKKAAGLLWEEGNNVVFRHNGVEKIKGANQVATPTDQVRDMVQAYVPATGAKRVYVGTDTKVVMYEFLANVWTPTDLHTWAVASQYADLETWGTWLIGTNGLDDVQVWKNTGVMADLAGTPFTRAKIVKRKNVFLFAFNTDNIGDTGVEWSTDSDIEVWTPGTSRAGNFVIRDLESEIVAVEDLGDRLAVYSRNGLALGTFVGGANVWGFKRAVSGIGAISNRSVVTLDPFNYGLTSDGIFKTDGVSYTYVDDPQMQEYIKDNADFSKGHLFWGMADSALRTVKFNFQDGSNVWRQVEYYPDAGYFTKGNLQLTAGDEKSVFDTPFVASEDLKLGAWQGSENHFGTAVSYSLKTKPLDFGERGVYKTLQMIRVDGKWTGGSIKVQILEDPEDTAPITVIDRALTKENYFPEGGRDGKYFTVEFYGTEPWFVSGVEFFGIPGGVAL